MQILGLEYLRFADGLKETAREEREEEFRQELMANLIKASLVASGGYKEEVLFADYLPAPDNDEIDFSDNAGVEFQTPTEDEMEILARMLADNTVTIDGAPLEGPGAEQTSPPEDETPSLPPPRDFDPTQVEQDQEWV